MNNFEYRAKISYQDEVVARHYEDLRFRSFLGRFVDRKEKSTVLAALRHATGSGHAGDTKLILDVPSGTGRISRFIAEHGYRVICADISLQMLRVAKSRFSKNTGLDFVRCDAEFLPFKKEIFDCIVCIRLMGHLPHNARKKILTELKRTTKEYMAVAYYNSHTGLGLLRKLSRKLTKSGESHWHALSKRMILSELGSMGLEPIQIMPLVRYLSETEILLIKKMR